jgi:G3E family GTPase
MVTVVDAVNLLKDYGSNDFLRQRGETAGADDTRTLVDLLVEQIEFADVVVINKARDVSPDHLDLVRSVVRGLNADARIVEASHGQVPPDAILNTGLFDEEKAQEHPLWFKELYGAHEHVPETEEYGIHSFVYRARRPLDPQKFQAFANTTWPGLIRAKGHFWLATRPQWVGEFSLKRFSASAFTRSGARSGATAARNSSPSAGAWTGTRSPMRSMPASSVRRRSGASMQRPIATCPIRSRPGARPPERRRTGWASSA